jgi:large conductance mechanosensitive channel
VLKGFKDFLMRGNVVELAVAVIVGTAFTAIVTAVADHLIQPIIAAIGGKKVTGLSWVIVDGNTASTVNFAAIITALINFAIIAAIVYFGFVLPVKSIQERRKRGEETGPAEPTDVEVLMEIRDLLREQQSQLQPVGRGGGPFPGGQAGQYPPGPGQPSGPGPMGPPPNRPGPSGPTGPPPGGPGPRTW